jgi:hypothetical protein
MLKHPFFFDFRVLLDVFGIQYCLGTKKAVKTANFDINNKNNKNETPL